MALKLRRGTNAQRLGITFAEGELVYITDSKKLYIGDGTSQGGNLVSGINNLLEDQTPQLGGNLDLNGNNIIGTGNINITGSLTMTTGFLAVDTKGSVFANDSGLLVDGIAGKHVLSNNTLSDLGNVAATAPTDGQVLKWNNSASQWQPQADSTGNHPLNSLSDVNAGSPQNLQALVWDSGTSKWVAGDVLQQGEFLDGDFRGSLFGDDSTLLINGLNNTFAIESANFSNILDLTATGSENFQGISVNTTNRFSLQINKTFSTPFDSNTNEFLGQIVAYNKASDGDKLRSAIYLADDGVYLMAGTPATDQYTYSPSQRLAFVNGQLGIGLDNPTEKLDVIGNAKMTGFVQFGSLTTTQRDALTAADGMVIYNSTTNKFQGRANSAWVNLH